jgi:hypothetical protein
MIIFQAVASRLFPSIVNSILGKIEMRSDFFHYPYIVKKYRNWHDKNNLLMGIPEDCKHIRTDGFLYGVFTSSHLNLEKDDFVFTLLNHPVDQIYEVYSYLNFTQNEEGPRSDEKLVDNPHFSNAEYPYEHRYAAERKVMGSMPKISLELFIDAVLSDVDLSFNYFDIHYQLIRENVYGFSDLSHFNYVGKYSNLEHAYSKLNSVFNTELEIPKDVRPLAFQGEQYKRELLEKKFENQIEFYNQLDC